MGKLRECDLKELADKYAKASDKERLEMSKKIINKLFNLDMQYNRGRRNG